MEISATRSEPKTWDKIVAAILKTLGSRARSGVAVLIAVLATVAISGCTQTISGPNSIFRPESDFASDLAGLFIFITIIAAVVFAIVAAAMVYVLIRYRRRRGDSIPRQVHGNTKLEIAWTIVPALILIVVIVPTIELNFKYQAAPPEDSLVINVTANQWWWEFEYPEFGIVTANEVHIPVGRTVTFNLGSADVIHSFWIPRLGGKRDVVPSRTNVIFLTATTPGNYGGQCAEFCGRSHANMLFRVIAEPEEAFARWAESEAGDSVVSDSEAARQGAELFGQSQCVACHTVRGTAAAGKIGPDLTHIGSRGTIAAGLIENNAENLAAWLKNPQEVKAGTLMPNLFLSDDQIDSYVAYLQSLQ